MGYCMYMRTRLALPQMMQEASRKGAGGTGTVRWVQLPGSYCCLIVFHYNISLACNLARVYLLLFLFSWFVFSEFDRVRGGSVGGSAGNWGDVPKVLPKPICLKMSSPVFPALEFRQPIIYSPHV